MKLMWLWNYALTSQCRRKEIRHSPGAIVMCQVFLSHCHIDEEEKEHDRGTTIPRLISCLKEEAEKKRKDETPPLSKNNSTAAAAATAATLARSSWPWQAYCHRPKTLSFHSAASSLEVEEDDSIEMVIHGARSEGRILFEPAGSTSSVVAAEESDDRWDRSVHGDLDEEEEDDEADKGVALYVVVESRDPYRDFRASMRRWWRPARLSRPTTGRTTATSSMRSSTCCSAPGTATD
ncbi:hypothetical protein SAY86_005427 [Trapa natans]|uniref:Ovate family protein n=1 Tax=Trapa natans TaxID=22666 RepID=A0AAN7L2W3_TRANT|nr:hypothetical protein SAY86_005427 [Trapa natans]